MATLGPRDTSSLVLLTGWDATELKKWELDDGTSIQAVFSLLNNGLGALNAEMTSGLWGSLISFQDRPEVEYRVGTSNGYTIHTEYSGPDPKRAATEGHMLPYVVYDRALGWTYDYIESARMDQIEADIADVIKDSRDRWRLSLLTRLLQRGDDSGATKGLGSSGYSPGFATTAGSTNVDFIPPAMGGTTFTSTHEHYVGIGGGVFTNAVFSDAKSELREHGHEPPYNFIIGPSDETTVRGLTDFVEVGSSLIAYGTQVNQARIDAGAIDTAGTYPIGTISDFMVYVMSGVPQYYGVGWKSYGNLSQRNPLRIRLMKGMSRMQVRAYNDPSNGSPIHPLQNMMTQMRFGVGVYDRTNGTARYVNNATWTDGTPT